MERWQWALESVRRAANRTSAVSAVSADIEPVISRLEARAARCFGDAAAVMTDERGQVKTWADVLGYWWCEQRVDPSPTWALWALNHPSLPPTPQGVGSLLAGLWLEHPLGTAFFKQCVPDDQPWTWRPVQDALVRTMRSFSIEDRQLAENVALAAIDSAMDKLLGANKTRGVIDRWKQVRRSWMGSGPPHGGSPLGTLVTQWHEGKVPSPLARGIVRLFPKFLARRLANQGRFVMEGLLLPVGAKQSPGSTTHPAVRKAWLDLVEFGLARHPPCADQAPMLYLDILVAQIVGVQSALALVEGALPEEQAVIWERLAPWRPALEQVAAHWASSDQWTFPYWEATPVKDGLRALRHKLGALLTLQKARALDEALPDPDPTPARRLRF